MGMFDTVYIQCPHCNETIEEQTKSGPRMLGHYSLEEASVSVMEGMLGEYACPVCSGDFVIERINKPSYRAVPVTKSGGETE